MTLTREQKNQALDIFETPLMFRPEGMKMLSEQEMELILLMGSREPMYETDLEQKIADAGIAKQPEVLIRTAYSRYVLRKCRDKNNGMMYQVSNFYNRMSGFAAYQHEEWERIPKERRDLMNEWNFEVYFNMHKDTVKAKMDGYDVYLHDGDFMTLDEAIAVLEKQDFIYLRPCNCKCLIDETTKSRNVCTQFWRGDNSDWDRGYGQRITRERAIEMVKEWNKEGLMQNGDVEHEEAFCNCDGLSCWPIRMARRLGARGHYPRAYWTIHWDESKCISCGKCAKLCNFHAFDASQGKVKFNPDNCWGCTMCTYNCPKGAITKTPRVWELKKPGEDTPQGAY